MFERLGRFFIHYGRNWHFFLFLTAPFCAVLLFLNFQFFSIRELEEIYFRAAKAAPAALKLREMKERFLERYSNCEANFLAQAVESVPLLFHKRQELRKKISHPGCQDRAALKSELADCEERQNRLVFLEEGFKTEKKMKETDEKLRSPVKVEMRDLERVLSLIENREIGDCAPLEHSPQMIVKEFSLQRKENDLYELDFSFLKREFSYE